MRFLPLIATLTASAAAAPLIQSKASVAEGNFCKTYQCQLLQRSVVAPETMHTLSYEYRVTGGTLTVGRLSTMEIFTGALTIPAGQWNTPMVRDFFRNFAGVTPEPSSVRACVRNALNSGLEGTAMLARGTVAGIGYQAECQAQRGGRVRLTVRDSRDLFR
ncbi:hypothetical protein [Deinococcus ficus]|uniref:hypothetical protein n=1 Tax=Deinococcus ficus TaxID=317577 RepID=UPI0003B46BE9|nr:hypothetical protein [Deinococcus ficus]